jgi:uncharacterized protein YbaP (TraB family)
MRRPIAAPPKLCRRLVLGLLWVAILAAGPPVLARADEPTIWSMKGARGEVLLLGSVHLMRSEDYPLPTNIDAAYEQADRLVMELSEGEIDPLEMQGLVMRIGRLQGGLTLAQVMGAGNYARATALADDLGYPLDLLDSVKPWLAAITIMNLHSINLGYRPELGLEQHLAARALRDGKPILGLETAEFQLRLFDGLSDATQSKLLLQTLAEASVMDDQLNTLISAWRRGDSAALNRELTRSFEAYPDAYRVLVVERNRTWTKRLVELADCEGVSFVIVGALHLIGKSSVVEMLSDQGHEITRWNPAE